MRNDDVGVTPRFARLLPRKVIVINEHLVFASLLGDHLQ